MVYIHAAKYFIEPGDMKFEATHISEMLTGLPAAALSLMQIIQNAFPISDSVTSLHTRTGSNGGLFPI